MHSEYAAGLPVAEPSSESLVCDAWVVVELVETCATPGPAGSPPQPAAMNATLASPASAGPASERLSPRLGTAGSVSKVGIAGISFCGGEEIVASGITRRRLQRGNGSCNPPVTEPAASLALRRRCPPHAAAPDAQ